ncbi:MAG TPA: DUF924 domain-containing protein [Cyanobacteria bacterium UBA11691]|nr:DUF924 domain-containing protein [Cyanobacteria bacterium UBA11691]
MNGVPMEYREIIEFWFDQIDPKQWWKKDESLDLLIRDRFGQIHNQATLCELYPWRTDPLGRLAEIIILDQFSRNIYRNQALAFAFDSLALALAQEAISGQTNRYLTIEQKSFLYLPFMHSESLRIHEIAVELFSQPGLESNLQFEYRHKEIIEKFGRYPHRNDLLGRLSTPEETKFLQQPGSSF